MAKCEQAPFCSFGLIADFCAKRTPNHFDTPSFSFLSVLTAFLFHIFAHTEQLLCKQEIEKEEEVMHG